MCVPQSLPYEKLIEQAMSLCLLCGSIEPSVLAELEGGGPYKFWPSVDPHAHKPFMPRNPLESLISGGQKDLPLLIGATRDEGAVFVAGIFNKVGGGKAERGIGMAGLSFFKAKVLYVRLRFKIEQKFKKRNEKMRVLVLFNIKLFYLLFGFFTLRIWQLWPT